MTGQAADDLGGFLAGSVLPPAVARVTNAKEARRAMTLAGQAAVLGWPVVAGIQRRVAGLATAHRSVSIRERTCVSVSV